MGTKADGDHEAQVHIVFGSNLAHSYVVTTAQEAANRLICRVYARYRRDEHDFVQWVMEIDPD